MNADPDRSTWQHMLVFYGSSHRHPVNIGIHVVCVPIIMGGAMVPLGWLQGEVGGLQLSAVWLFVALVAVGASLLDGVAALFLSPILVAQALFVTQVAHLPWTTGAAIGGAMFVGGYLAQFVGHAIEGRPPALTERLWLAQVSAPLFVAAELARMVGLRREQWAQVDARLDELDAQGVSARA